MLTKLSLFDALDGPISPEARTQLTNLKFLPLKSSWMLEASVATRRSVPYADTPLLSHVLFIDGVITRALRCCAATAVLDSSCSQSRAFSWHWRYILFIN